MAYLDVTKDAKETNEYGHFRERARTRTIEDRLHVQRHKTVPAFFLRKVVIRCTPGSTRVVHQDMELGLLGFERIR